MEESTSFFGDPDPIFADKELLRVSHLPQGDRIIGREDELQSLAKAIKDAQRGGTPNNVLIYGKTGTGKSLCSKYITRDLANAGAENGVSIGIAYVDCFQESTETQTIRTIAQSLNDPETTDITVPHSGVSTSDYYRRLWDILDARLDVGIIILDEIDKLEDDNVLMQLSRAAEAGKVSDSTLGIIGISNKIRYKDTLNERVKSSLSERDFVFPPYDASQLRAILRSRADAFRDDVLSGDVIPKVAALAAREHGDARKAIDILRYAGEIADEHDSETVTIEFVDEANDREEQARLSELISKQPTHSRYLMTALALRTQESSEEEPRIPSKQVYSAYQIVCDREGVGPLKMRRIRDLLSELAFLSLIEQDRKGRGKGKGAHTVNELVDDPEIVVEACKS
ncbi:Cdc6/Cdc18 family protein [Halococcus salsus]|uniref:Cdc6/Cdc18 family protein n=1 Tax=Halococcus salsus TaxID=2162894 RepID=UPI00135A51E1|nr:orc1/cdc6 family replication initiation protein [Halococcus salsus]